MNNLFELSADEKKRLEYEAREKAIRDYNTQMKSAEQRGRTEERELAVKVIELKFEGMSAEQIARKLDLPLEYVYKLTK